MPTKKSNLQLIPRSAAFSRNLPAYLIAFIGAGASMLQGGIWAALTVFVVALIAATVIDIFRR